MAKFCVFEVPSVLFYFFFTKIQVETDLFAANRVKQKI